MPDDGLDAGMYAAWAFPVAPNVPCAVVAPVRPEVAVLADPRPYLPVDMATWFRQHPEPLLRSRLGPMPYVVSTLEPTLILTPNMDTWFTQISQPVRNRLRPIERMIVEVEAPHETLIPRIDNWLPVCTPPPVRPQQPQAGWWAGVLERTLFETPGLDTWFCQSPDPIRLPTRIPLDRVEPPEWRPLAIGSQLLAWCVQSPSPMRVSWHPGEVTYIQPPAITPADTVLTFGETAIFKSTAEDDDLFLRT